MINNRFFNIEHRHVLFTKNNWISFSFGDDSSKIDKTYVEEMNSSIKQKVVLRHLYGEQTASLILDEFDKIDSAFYSIKRRHLELNEGYGKHFEIFAVATLYNVSYKKTIEDYLIIGRLDGGIDAIFYNDSDVFVLQIKMKQLEEDNAVELMMNTIDEYEKKHFLSDGIKKDLNSFLDKHYDKDIYGKTIHYITISKNSCRPENKTPESIYNTFIENTIERSKLIFKNGIEIFKNNKKESVVHKSDELHKEIFLFANANEFVDSLNKHVESEDNIDYLFVDNVRGRLKRNNAIVQTIKTEPGMFSFYNNGISIIGNFETQETSSKIVVKNPLIINGQQTVMSLLAAKKDGSDLSKVFVPVFLKSVANEEELRKIARFNNSQTKITSLDLLSIDSNLRKIQSELLSTFVEDRKDKKESFYLDIVRNGKNKHKDTAKRLFDKSHIISVGEFVKLYSVLKDKENLGLWKNALDSNINKFYKNGFDYVETDKARNICKSICDSKHFIDGNNEYKIADLVVQYLLYFGYNGQQISSIVNHINNQSDNDNISRASVYKKNDIIDKVRKTLIYLSIDNKFDINQ